MNLQAVTVTHVAEAPQVGEHLAAVCCLRLCTFFLSGLYLPALSAPYW